MMVPAEPADRDFAIECFLNARCEGRTTSFDDDEMLQQLRQAGDVRRLERVARIILGAPYVQH